MTCKDCRHAGAVRRGDIVGTSNRGAGGAAWLCALSAIAAFAAGPAGAADVVTLELWPTAVVTGDTFTLDDVARVRPGGNEALAAALRTCDLGASPSRGNSLILTPDDISEALAKAGVNPVLVILRGSSRCQVSRPAAASTRPADVPANPGAKAAASRPARPAGDAKPAARAGRSASPEREAAEPGTLGAAVHDYIAARLADLGGSPQIRFSPAAQRALALSSPTYTFRLRQRGNDVLGLVALEADVLEGTKVVETVPIVAEVTLLKPVVVARSAINSGEIIQAKHLMLAERQFKRASDVGLSDPRPLIGQEACRFIENGAMVSARDVRARPLVKRGDLVTVWVRRGDLVIKSVAKAQRAGVFGEVIDVKNEATGEAFPVTVTGPQTAEAGAGGVPGPAAGGPGPAASEARAGGER